MNNELVNDLLLVGSLFNPYKLAMLAIGGLFLWGLNYLSQRVFQYLMELFPTHRFSIYQAKTLFSFSVYILGSLVLLVGVVQPPREVLLAATGSVALALGFALKDVAASILAGLVLLFDRPFVVGDRVAFAGVYGEIVEIGLRSVRLKTLDDNMVTIPNARFMSEVVASGNAGALDMMVVCNFHLALDADIERAREIIHEVIVTSRFAYLEKPVVITVEEIEVAQRLALRLQAKAYVLDVVYEKAFQTDIVIRTAKLFVRDGISRPVMQINQSLK